MGTSARNALIKQAVIINYAISDHCFLFSKKDTNYFGIFNFSENDYQFQNNPSNITVIQILCNRKDRFYNEFIKNFKEAK